jgi:hypothetical protein
MHLEKVGLEWCVYVSYTDLGTVGILYFVLADLEFKSVEKLFFFCQDDQLGSKSSCTGAGNEVDWLRTFVRYI